MTTTSDQNAAAPPRFDGLRALFINATLKRSPELSHTGGLIERSSGIMREHGVQVDTLRAVDHDIATGVWPDMTEHGWATDEWPASEWDARPGWPTGHRPRSSRWQPMWPK